VALPLAFATAQPFVRTATTEESVLDQVTTALGITAPDLSCTVAVSRAESPSAMSVSVDSATLTDAGPSVPGSVGESSPHATRASRAAARNAIRRPANA